MTLVSKRLYKESFGGYFHFKLNCGPLNLFSERLELILDANAPFEFLNRMQILMAKDEDPNRFLGYSFFLVDSFNCYRFFYR